MSTRYRRRGTQAVLARSIKSDPGDFLFGIWITVLIVGMVVALVFPLLFWIWMPLLILALLSVIVWIAEVIREAEGG